MKTLRRFAVSATTLTCLLAALILSGSGGRTAAQGAPDKNSFNEVTAHLEKGGVLYGYLSTEAWLKGLSDNLNKWRGFAETLPGVDPGDSQVIGHVFEVVTSVIKDSGIEQVSGYGISAVEREKGFYHNVAVLHHYPGQDAGLIWSAFGKTAHDLAGLDFMPTNTAFGGFSDLDLQQIWTLLDKEMKTVADANSGVGDAWRAFPDQFQQATGLRLDKVLSSLAGECGFVLTLDESRMIPIPLPGQPMQFPEPGILIVLKVKDDLIFDRFDALMQGNPSVIKTDRDGLKMRTMPVPIPLPILLRPSVARSGDYLFLATTDKLIETALAVKAGKEPGLKSTDEFKRLSREVPAQGNSFAYVSPRFSKAFLALSQQQAQNAPPAQAAMMQNMMALGRTNYTYTVSANSSEGWINIGNSSQNPANTMILAPVAAVAIGAGVALPAFAKARATAQNGQPMRAPPQMNGGGFNPQPTVAPRPRTACPDNLKAIEGAKQQWALEHKKAATDVPTWQDLLPYLSGSVTPRCPSGGRYTINAVGTPASCSIHGTGQ